MEQYLEDLILERESISLLHDRIGQLIDEQIHGMKSIGADAIMILGRLGNSTADAD